MKAIELATPFNTADLDGSYTHVMIASFQYFPASISVNYNFGRPDGFGGWYSGSYKSAINQSIDIVALDFPVDNLDEVIEEALEWGVENITELAGGEIVDI